VVLSILKVHKVIPVDGGAVKKGDDIIREFEKTHMS